MNRCSMTRKVADGPSDAVWDDGEWISWDWLSQQQYEQELRERYPDVNPQIAEILEELVETARNYKDLTGRYLPVFGELGELFAEITLESKGTSLEPRDRMAA